MSNKTQKNRTGRGLDALLEGASIMLAKPGQAFAVGDNAPVAMLQADTIREISINLIDANPNQPRTHIENEELEGLAQSIRELGIITPITVRKLDNGRYQIISGERRCKAARMAELDGIPAYVLEADDRSMQIMALVENIQREDLNPIDIAAAFQDLIEKYDLTHEKISEMVGMNRASITNYLRLLKLPPEIQDAVRAETISMGHAKVLMSVDNADTQNEIVHKIVQQNLSVRQVEDLLKIMNTSKPEKTKSPTSVSESVDSMTQDLLLQLKELFNHHLSGQTTLKTKADGTTRITIDLKNNDDIQLFLTKFAD
jgi:ParB family chromosome partitioning protein